MLRLPVAVAPALLLAVMAARPWRWTEDEWARLDLEPPTGRLLAAAALAAGLALFWVVLTRFQSGDINAVDFTVYFDRPSFQTIQHKPLFVETADRVPFSWRSELTVHAYWAMLAIAQLYRLTATPLWLLGLAVVAVVAGATHVLRIVRLVTGSTILGAAAWAAFLLNDNTARALNYGFHPEILYAWFVPWAIDAGLRRSKRSFVLAVVACLLVKEDACMALFAASAALAFARYRDYDWTERVLFLAMPMLAGLANLGFYFMHVVPSLAPDGIPTYASFWANYGATPVAALAGMARHPVSVFARAAASGFFPTVMVPFLFLPLVGWRWCIGAAPIVLLYGAAANEQLRAFGLYYAAVLVPFLVVAAAVGARSVSIRLVGLTPRASAAGAALLVTGSLLVGGGYSLRPWRAEIAGVPAALAQLSSERIVLVQSGLYPHAGYSPRVQLLTAQTARDAMYAGGAVLLAPRISAYPLDPAETARLAQLPSAGRMPTGLMAVRLPPEPRR